MAFNLEERQAFESDVADRALAIEPLPASVVRLTQLVNGAEDGAVDMVEVADVLNLDQGLLGKVLAEANSASHAARRTIGTASDALLRIGVVRVVTLALADSTSALLDPPVPAYGLEKGELTLYSQLASISAERLKRATGQTLPAEVVTASLLHDIGMVVMGGSMSDEHVTSLSKARDAVGDWSGAENEILGLEHGEVGRIILDEWGLPLEIGLAVQYHHHPNLGGGVLAYGVALADVIAHSVDDGDVGDVAELMVDDRALTSAAELSLSEADLVELVAEVAGIWAERTQAEEQPSPER